MTSSLSGSTPGRWQDASLDILMGRRGGGAPSNRAWPSIAEVPIDWPAGIAPGGGGGGPVGSGEQAPAATTHHANAAATATRRARRPRKDNPFTPSDPRKPFTLVNSLDTVNKTSGEGSAVPGGGPPRAPRRIQGRTRATPRYI